MSEKVNPITVSVTRTVKPGCEEEFEAALHAFVQLSLNFPGQMGVNILRPAPGSDSREYGILRRFSNAAAMEAFYASDLFKSYNEMIEHMVEGPPREEHVTGLETWFTLPGQKAIIPPPPWKMAVVTLAGVYPTSLFLTFLFGTWIGLLPQLLGALAFSSLMVILLNWMVMPALSRFFKKWLYPTKTRT